VSLTGEPVRTASSGQGTARSSGRKKHNNTVKVIIIAAVILALAGIGIGVYLGASAVLPEDTGTMFSSW